MGVKDKWRAILLFGPPGSGKGTQGKALGSIPGFLHVASGEIFRQLYKLGSHGKEVTKYTSNGKLVPDDLTIQIWGKHMNVLRDEGTFNPDEQIVLLDGIPRTYEQAKYLSATLDVLAIFSLELGDDEEAVQRIKLRATKEGRVDDAREEVIRGRLATFHQQTSETLSYYDPSLILRINASQLPLKVLADMAGHICELLESPAETRSATGLKRQPERASISTTQDPVEA